MKDTLSIRRCEVGRSEDRTADPAGAEDTPYDTVSAGCKVDISTKYLSNIECGDKVPKFETFVAIANALEVDANSLLVDVLTVSSVIISSEITEKLAKLSPYEQRRVKRLFDVIIEDEAGDHK